jgi:6-pyruvoyltetrahydropterin/6-carboxytetrahydropterin synthase
MSVATCTRRLEFDAGHRLQKHESKCRNVHGHRYVLEVTCSADTLDSVGRVIDFAAIKHIVGKWVDDHLDHGFIVQEGDFLITALTQDGTKHHVVPFSPTAENLVVYIAEMSQKFLRSLGIRVTHARLYETPNCWADWSAP